MTHTCLLKSLVIKVMHQLLDHLSLPMCREVLAVTTAHFYLGLKLKLSAFALASLVLQHIPHRLYV